MSIALSLLALLVRPYRHRVQERHHCAQLSPHCLDGLVLFAAARDDPILPVEQVQALYRTAKSRDKQLEILGGSYTGLHGWDLLGGSHGASFTPFAAKVAGFVSAQTRS